MKLSPEQVRKMTNQEILENSLMMLNEYQYGRNNYIDPAVIPALNDAVEDLMRLKELANKLTKKSDIIDRMYDGEKTDDE